MAEEIVWTWETFEDLVEAIAHAPDSSPREGDESEGDVVRFPTTQGSVMSLGGWARNDEDPDLYHQHLQKMQFSFIDGDGAPLKFPLRLKSDTSFEDITIDKFSLFEVLGRPLDQQHSQSVGFPGATLKDHLCAVLDRPIPTVEEGGTITVGSIPITADGRLGLRLDFTYDYLTPSRNWQREAICHHVDDDVLTGGVPALLKLFNSELLEALEQTELRGVFAPTPTHMIDLQLTRVANPQAAEAAS